MVDEEQILSLIRMQGPVIPVQVAKKIGQNILFTSAILGELSSKGKLKISSVKVGGTPLYYIAGQESGLQKYSKNLHEKEQKAYEKLKEGKILRDKVQEPVIRVALREIKDFAVPLEVSFEGQTEIFWKWFLLKNEEAEELIRKVIEPFKKKEEPVKEEPKVEEKVEPEKPKEKTPESKPEKKEEPQQEKLEQDIKPQGDFHASVLDYFTEKEIKIQSQNILRKGSDIEFVVTIPSAVGTLNYFVKARSKKNSNDGDLSSAFLQGQRKNLPVMYITTGKVTKKGKETAKKEFPSMVIEEL